MALQWDYRLLSGTVTEARDGREYTFPWYEGNALMIVIHEYEKDGERYAELQWFFTGKDHAERCLGLRKCSDGTKHNMFGDHGITRLVIYRSNCREWETLVKLFLKAFPDIVIEIRATPPADDGQKGEAQ